MRGGGIKAVILLNGEPFRGELCADGYVICCDGAYSWAKGRVKIDENVGDFDSLFEEPVPPPREKFPSEKNETDGELAVSRALELGATDFVFYGGEGGRADHFLGNLHLLLKALEGGAERACLVGNAARFFLCGTGKQVLACKRGQTLSLLPFGGGAHIMESGGLKYPLGDLWLRYGSTRGISNVATDEKVSFFVAEGRALAVINEEGT